MKVLGIDTATMMGSIGLIDDEGAIAEYSLNIRATHSERLMPAIDRLLKDSGIMPKDIDGFAVSIGPGSFTGLRIGLATVKGFAMGCNKPVAAVSTLEALAFNLAYAEYLICPILDARRNEVYSALFKSDGKGGMKRLVQDMAIDMQTFLREYDEDIIFLGDAVDIYRERILDILKDRAHFAPKNRNMPSGVSVAELGLKKIRDGKAVDPSGLAPFYIRRPEAEVNLEKKKTALGGKAFCI
ncbi:MAG: tRNA (adenosine(37)-N6)-threonylcarbamoyltransferase complex dimerization subunit type 1 TsaB [Nitrospirota bacterium]